MKRRSRAAERKGAKSVTSLARSQKRAADTARTRRQILAAVAAVAILAAGYSSYRFRPRSVSDQAMLEQARKALVAEDYAAAEELSLRHIGRQGPSASALLVAGEAAAHQGRFTDALGYYAQLPEDAGKEAAVGYAAAGEILLRMRRASAAEIQFRKALALDSGLLLAHERLGYLLGIEGRRWESLPHLYALLRAHRLSKEMLILLGHHAAAIDGSKELREFRQAAPDDPMPLIGQARLAIRRTRMREAKQLLKEALAEAPDQIEAQAELGHLLWTEADPEFNQWLVEAAPGTEDHPDIWLTRGLWAKQQGQTRGAARCFWEAIRLDPGQQAGAYHWGQVLQVLDDPQSARRLNVSDVAGALHD
jgi:tetratricopeptide (TPR) repeat protein